MRGGGRNLPPSSSDVGLWSGGAAPWPRQREGGREGGCSFSFQVEPLLLWLAGPRQTKLESGVSFGPFPVSREVAL